MTVYNALTRLEDVYQKLEEGFYSVGDYPLPDDKFISNDPYISQKLLDEFLDIIIELDDLLNGSRLIKEILSLIEEDSPINNFVLFNEQDYAMDLTNENPESHNENLNSIMEQSSKQAHEEKTNLINEALEDIKRLMEELLPLLVE